MEDKVYPKYIYNNKLNQFLFMKLTTYTTMYYFIGRSPISYTPAN